MRALVITLLAILIGPHTQAADFRDDTFVRGGAVIQIQLDGKIVKGDYEKFRGVMVSAIKKNIYDHGISRIVIFPNTGGGNVSEAMRIGRAVSDLGAIIYIKKDEVCASACVFIWMGGPIPSGQIGKGRLLIHNPYLRDRKMEYEKYERIMLQAQREMTQYIKSLNLPVETVMNEILGTNSNELAPMKKSVVDLVSNRRAQMRFEWLQSQCGKYPKRQILDRRDPLNHPWFECTGEIKGQDALRRIKKYAGLD